jgi:DNA-binding FrmR family transcriptional regulator
MSDMGDMKFTTAGDMMGWGPRDLPARLESWAQNEELVASGFMTAHGQDCMDVAEQLRAALFLIDEYQTELIECHNYMDKLRAALRDMAKHIWRGDWDKLEPETRALLGEKE